MLNRFKGSFMLLIAAMIWGTAFAAQSSGMKYVEPFTYNSIRTIIGGTVLIPVIALFRKNGNKYDNKKAGFKTSFRGGIFCGIILFAASSLQQYGISLTSAGKAGFITALYVVIVSLIGFFTGKHSGKRIWLCVLIAVCGFYLLCVSRTLSISRGDIYVLLSAFFYALHIIAIDRFNSNNADSMIMSCVQFFTAGTVMLICMFIFESPSFNSIIAARYTILYTGVMSCAVAYTLQIIGQRYTHPAIATLIMSLESVFAALSGWLILGEKLSFKELSGCFLVFSAVISAQPDISFKKTKKDL